MKYSNRILAMLLASSMVLSCLHLQVFAQSTGTEGETTSAVTDETGTAGLTQESTDGTTAGTDPTITGTDPTITGTDPTITGTDPTVTSTDPALSFVWDDPEQKLNENGQLVLEGASLDAQYTLDTVRSMLPRSLTLEDSRNVKIRQWDCDTYVTDAEGRWPVSGEFVFRASLAEDIVFAETAQAREVCVILVPAPADQKTDSAVNQGAVVPDDKTTESSVHAAGAEPLRGLTANTGVEYQVTVIGGTAVPEKAAAGAEVTLTPDPDIAGRTFLGWEVTEGTAQITDHKFIMPEGNVTLKAVYSYSSFTWRKHAVPVQDGRIVVTEVSVNSQINLETLKKVFLPDAIILPGDRTVMIRDWECPEYVLDQNGIWPLSGDFVFTAMPEEEIHFSEDAGPRIVIVHLEKQFPDPYEGIDLVENPPQEHTDYNGAVYDPVTKTMTLSPGFSFLGKSGVFGNEYYARPNTMALPDGATLSAQGEVNSPDWEPRMNWNKLHNYDVDSLPADSRETYALVSPGSLTITGPGSLDVYKEIRAGNGCAIRTGGNLTVRDASLRARCSGSNTAINVDGCMAVEGAAVVTDSVHCSSLSLTNHGVLVCINGFQEAQPADRTQWQGILIEKEQGQVYGDVRLARNLTIPFSNAVLTIPQGSKLTIPAGITLDCRVPLRIEGILEVESGGALRLFHAESSENLGTVTVKGKMDLETPLVNSGEVTVGPGGCMNVFMGLVNGKDAVLTVEPGGTLSVDQKAITFITTYGMISNTGSLRISGRLVNREQVKNIGSLSVEVSGVLENIGVLESGSGSINNQGTILNQKGASMTHRGIQGNAPEGEGTVTDVTQTESLPEISYVAEDGSLQKAKAASLKSTDSTLVPGWYVVDSDVTIPGQVMVYGDVKLILQDGCTLDSQEGVQIFSEGSLTVFGQSQGTGSLIVRSKGTAIYGANLAIHGGQIQAIGEDSIDVSSLYITGGCVESNQGISYARITGGWVQSGGPVRYTTGTEGKAFVCCKGGGYMDEEPSGILSNNEGITTTVFGSQTLMKNLTVEAGQTMSIPEGTALTIPNGVTLTNEGTIDNQGILDNTQGKIVNNGAVFKGAASEIRILNDSSHYEGKMPGNLQRETVSYYDPVSQETKTVENVVVLDAFALDSYNRNLPGGWYLIRGQKSFSGGISSVEPINLILEDGADVTVNAGLEVALNTKNLTVWGQSMGNPGKLRLKNQTTIESFYDTLVGTVLTINGGILEVDTKSSEGIPDKNFTSHMDGSVLIGTCLTMNNGLLNVKADRGYAGIRLGDASFYMNGGKIEISGNSKYGITNYYPTDDTVYHMTGGEIIAEGYTDGICLLGQARTYKMTGGKLQGISTEDGYGVMLETIQAEGGEILGKSKDGNGIQIESGDDTTVFKNCLIQGISETAQGLYLGRNTSIENSRIIGRGQKQGIALELNAFLTKVINSVILCDSLVKYSQYGGRNPVEIPESDREAWSGLVLEGKDAKAYGSYTLQQDLEIPADGSLLITQNSSLTVPAGKKLTNLGTVTVDGSLISAGTLRNEGAISGTGSISGTGRFETTQLQDVGLTILTPDTYTGADLSPAVRLTQTILGQPFDVLGWTKSFDKDPVKNAGTYEVTYTRDVTQETQKKSFTVNPAVITGSVSQEGTLVYDSAAQSAEISSGLVTVGGQPITLKFGTVENTCNSETVPGFTDAGAYTVYYCATAPNHNALKGKLTVNIDKAQISDAEVTVAAPEPLAEPQTDCSLTSCTGAITWDGTMDSGRYWFNTVYTAHVTLTPDGNHRFNEEAVRSTGLTGAKLNADGTITGTLIFPATRKALVQSITAPQNQDVKAVTADAAMAELPGTVTITAEDGTTTLNISWQLVGIYDPAPKAVNTFRWTAEPGDLDGSSQTLTGDIEATNMANVLQSRDPVLAQQDGVWVDGIYVPVTRDGDGATLVLPGDDCRSMVTYTYNSTGGDPHSRYPTGMQVWMLQKVDGFYEATRVQELDNLLHYAGCSIRLKGKNGIRMITALDKDTKSALIGDGLAGCKLVEYGTVVAWTENLNGQDPVLGGAGCKSNYAYKKDVADPVFKNVNGQIQYTNVLVGFSLDDCRKELSLRPYVLLEDQNGRQIPIYGGTVQRSIGYIAYQNRNAFPVGSAAYDYVWNIIHHVYGNKFDSRR